MKTLLDVLECDCEYPRLTSRERIIIRSAINELNTLRRRVRELEDNRDKVRTIPFSNTHSST